MSFIPETFKDCAKDYVENAEKVSHSIYKFEFLNCRCTDFFGTDDACSVRWFYFCREIGISGFGEGLENIQFSAFNFKLYSKLLSEIHFKTLCYKNVTAYIETFNLKGSTRVLGLSSG